jgi:hypothetical protein
MGTKKEMYERYNMTDHGDRPNLFEYDPKNDIVDVFVYKDTRCPYPFTITNTRDENDKWFHQGFFKDDFIRALDVFLRKNHLPYHIVEE